MDRVEQALLEDIHKHGAVLWEDLVRRHPGSTPYIEPAIRKHLLRKTCIGGARILSLGTTGRLRFGIKGNRPHAPATLLNELTGRVLIEYYEKQGWTYEGKFSRHGYRFSHPEKTNEYVFLKRTDYRHEYLQSVAYEYMTEALRNHAYLIYYAREATPSDYSRYSGHRITLRDFKPILETAHPKARHLLEKALV